MEYICEENRRNPVEAHGVGGLIAQTKKNWAGHAGEMRKADVQD